MPDLNYTITSPQTTKQFEKYYQLRWKILREPWGQPAGSEKDQLEQDSFHIMAVAAGEVIGVGRLHLISRNKAQIRYMAVDEKYQNRSVGTSILNALERRAALLGAEKILLDARENALGFYQKAGYKIIAPSHTLFGVIKHVKMEKTIGR
jgi:N-acetylglutamate synthase-like GNAT family acetyltransferase